MSEKTDSHSEIRELFIEELEQVAGGFCYRRPEPIYPVRPIGPITTMALGEEDGGGVVTSQAIGEEDGGPIATTQAVGEEDGGLTF